MTPAEINEAVALRLGHKVKWSIGAPPWRPYFERDGSYGQPLPAWSTDDGLAARELLPLIQKHLPEPRFVCCGIHNDLKRKCVAIFNGTFNEVLCIWIADTLAAALCEAVIETVPLEEFE